MRHWCRKAWLLFGVLAYTLTAWPVARADLPAELRGQRIIGVRVAGESAQIAAPDVTGVPLGERLGRDLVRAAIERLLASGRWVDVQVEAQAAPAGVVLIFHLEPRITLRRVEIRGDDQVDEQVTRDALGVSAGSELRPDALTTLAAAARKAYAERGYLGTRIDVRFRDTDDPSQKVLLVEIDEGGPTRIARLVFSGQVPNLADDVFASMDLHEGDVLNRRRLAEALLQGERHLRAQNYLEAHIAHPVIRIASESAELTFPIHLGPRYTLQVDGATPLRAADIAGAFLLFDAPLTTETLEAIPGKIRDLYNKNGFPEARVSVARTRVPESNRALLRARIDPGTQLRVVGVAFAGSHFYSGAFLREQLESYLDEDLPGGGLAGTVDSEVAGRALQGENLAGRRQLPRPQDQAPEQTYYGPTYVEAVKHISELYQADGFLSASVGPPVLQRLDASRATVNIPVVEGPRTLLYRVVLTGQELVPSQELLLASGLARNTPFSYLMLEEARLRMQQLYQERGHMFVRIEPSVRFSNDHTRAEVSFQIVERFPVRISEIVVRGADRTSADFIRSVMELGPGDLFRPSKARDSERRLSALGVFSGVSVELEDPDLPARVKRLLVILSERRNQFLDFGAGLSTGQGARFGFDYGYRNLLGRAVGLTLRVQFAYQLFVRPELRERFDKLLFSERLERNISLGTVIPHLPGLGSTRTNLDLVHVRDNERDFGVDKNGITLAFTETPWERVTIVEAADLENNNVDLFETKAISELLAMTPDLRLRRLLRVPEGDTTLVALRTQVSYDQRDNAFIPTRGYYVSASGELATTLNAEGGKSTSEFLSRFLKVQVSGSGYIPLGRSFVLAGQLRVGRIVHLSKDSRTYPNRAFFLGGVDTMRGYYQDELIPQDVADQTLKSTSKGETDKLVAAAVRSGDAFVLVRGELRFPIYGQLGGGLFADVGNLWADAANMDPFDLRPTAGAGLRLNTPVGPIAVDYGIVLQRRSRLHEPFGTLHFSIGLF